MILKLKKCKSFTFWLVSVYTLLFFRVSKDDFYGRLYANFKVYKDSYLSHVIKSSDGKGNYKIDSTAESSLFKYLNSRWELENRGPNDCHSTLR